MAGRDGVTGVATAAASSCRRAAGAAWLCVSVASLGEGHPPGLASTRPYSSLKTSSSMLSASPPA